MNPRAVCAISVLCGILIGAGSAYSDGVCVDVLGAYASDPGEQAGSTQGVSVGVSFPLQSMPDLYLRGDASFYSWSNTTEGWWKISWDRVPVFLGGRYYHAFGQARLYGEIGVEVSRDTRETTASSSVFFAGEHRRETIMDISAGLGVDFPITDAITVGVNTRSHGSLLYDYPYLTVGGVVGLQL